MLDVLSSLLSMLRIHFVFTLYLSLSSSLFRFHSLSRNAKEEKSHRISLFVQHQKDLVKQGKNRLICWAFILSLVVRLERPHLKKKILLTKCILKWNQCEKWKEKNWKNSYQWSKEMNIILLIEWKEKKEIVDLIFVKNIEPVIRSMKGAKLRENTVGL